MTEKLYYIDSYIKRFSAKVISCEEYKENYKVVLDKTAFYPEGGGQPADKGNLSNSIVSNVIIKDEIIYHIVDTPLKVGEEVEGSINFDRRFDMMQQHSGEHIISGIINKKYGYNNVGFHLGEEYMTADIDGELTDEQISEIETLANEAIYQNLSLAITIQTNEEVKNKIYRSKIELNGDVRLVEVPGYGICACCGTHVKQTGEIGIIKIIDRVKHRGGMRLTVVCGRRAVKDYDYKQNIIYSTMGLLSASPDKIIYQIERLKEELSEAKIRQSEIIGTLISYKIDEILNTDREVYLIDEQTMPMEDVRRMCIEMIGRTNKICMIVRKEGEIYKYVIGSKSEDIRDISRKINAEFNGKGGGNSELCQGSIVTQIEELTKFIMEMK